MTNFRELTSYARNVSAQYPDLKEEIYGLVDLCEAEIEEGGSVQHEINLCKRDIDEIVEERTKDRI
jgi:RNA-splicing ligase RtcB